MDQRHLETLRAGQRREAGTRHQGGVAQPPLALHAHKVGTVRAELVDYIDLLNPSLTLKDVLYLQPDKVERALVTKKGDMPVVRFHAQ